MEKGLAGTGPVSALPLCLEVVMHFENQFEADSSAMTNFEVSIHFFCSKRNAKLIFKTDNCSQGKQDNKGRNY